MIRIAWPYRPDYERWTLTALSLSIVLVLASLFSWKLLFGFDTVIPSTMGLVVLMIVAIVDLNQRQNADHLRTRLEVPKISYDDLKTIVMNNPGMFYLGEGYNLNVPESSAIYKISENGLDAKWDTGDQKYNHGAVWISAIRQLEPILVPVNYMVGHTVLPGTTRAGKTFGIKLLITQCIMRGESVIVLDPKNEPSLKECVEDAYARRGLKAHYMSLSHPDKSVRLNTLRNGVNAEELATRISANLPSTSEGADPFTAVSHMALTKIMAGLMALGTRPTLLGIRRYLEDGAEALVAKNIKHWADQIMPTWLNEASTLMKSKKSGSVNDPRFLIDFYEKVMKPTDKYRNEVIDGLIAQITHNREHFSKMIISLMPMMTSLTTGELGTLLSPDPDDRSDKREIVNIYSIMERGEGLYVGLSSMSQEKAAVSTGSMFCTEMTACAADRYNYREIDQETGTELPLKPVNIFVDESTEIINRPLIQMLNKGGGANIRVYLCLQTKSDAVVRLGSADKASMAIGNLNNLLSFRLQDPVTQELVTDKMQKITVTDVSYSRGETESQSTLGTSKSANISARQTQRQVPLFPPSLLSKMPNMTFVGKFTSGRTVVGRIPIVEGVKSAEKEASR